MFSTVIVAALIVIGVSASDLSDADPVISEARAARSRQLWRFCHAYLERVHRLGCNRIEHDLDVDVNDSRPAIVAALVAAESFLNGDTDQPISDLAHRLGLDKVQHRVGEYIAASIPESSDPTFQELVRAHRAWRLIENVISDALARVLLRHPTADVHVMQTKIIMQVVGREAFVLPVLARALSLRQSSDLPRTGAELDQYDAVTTVREHLRDGSDQTLFGHLVWMFEDGLPPVLTKRVPDLFTAGTEFLARLWWSGFAGLTRRRPCLEQFVLGFGINVADYLLANDPVMEGFAEQSSRDLLIDTLPFDQMFDQLMLEVKSKLQSLLPNHIPNKLHLISIIMEIFCDLERPRHLLQWLNESDPSQRKSKHHTRQILFGSIEPILDAVLGRQEI